MSYISETLQDSGTFIELLRWRRQFAKNYGRVVKDPECNQARIRLADEAYFRLIQFKDHEFLLGQFTLNPNEISRRAAKVRTFLTGESTEKIKGEAGVITKTHAYPVAPAGIAQKFVELLFPLCLLDLEDIAWEYKFRAPIGFWATIPGHLEYNEETIADAQGAVSAMHVLLNLTEGIGDDQGFTALVHHFVGVFVFLPFSVVNRARHILDAKKATPGLIHSIAGGKPVPAVRTSHVSSTQEKFPMSPANDKTVVVAKKNPKDPRPQPTSLGQTLADQLLDVIKGGTLSSVHTKGEFRRLC